MDNVDLILAVKAGIAAALRWDLTEQPRVLIASGHALIVPLDRMAEWITPRSEWDGLVTEEIKLESFTGGERRVLIGYGEKSGVLAIGGRER